MVYKLKILKGHKSILKVGGVMIPYFCTLPDDALYLYKDLQNISKDFRVTAKLKFTKGHDSVKNVRGVDAFCHFTLYDNVTYLYVVSQKYLKGFQTY